MTELSPAIFNFDDYRECLRHLVGVARQQDAKHTLASLAEAARVQRPYLSNVLAGRAGLNADQIFLIATALELDAGATEYLVTLLEVEKCQVEGRKVLLQARLATLKQQAQKSDGRVLGETWQLDDPALAQYYADALNPVVHIYLSIDRFLHQPMLLAERLRVEPRQIKAALATLASLGLITVDGETIRVCRGSVHITAGHWLSRLHTSMFRMKAIERSQNRREDDYFFSATFSANADVRARFKTRWLTLLKELTADIEEAETETVYQVNFDLFEP